MFTPENLKKIEDLRTRYPTARALVLPVLWMAQEQAGWISRDTMEHVASLLNLPLGHVYSVVTFYTMFNTKPTGKYHLQVCTNVSCQLRGADKIVEHICERLRIPLGGMTSDEKFTVSEVECLGSCGTAPAIQVNDDYYEDLTPEKVDKLLTGLK